MASLQNELDFLCGPTLKLKISVPITQSSLSLDKPSSPAPQSFFEVQEELPGQSITFAEKPTDSLWKLIPIFMDNVLGATMIWQVGFDMDTQLLTTLHGQVGGSLQRDSRKIVENTSGRTLMEQALLEARSRYKDKLHQGYTPAGTELPLDLRNTAPALAYKYEPPAEGKMGNVTYFPIAAEAKLDGIRALAKRNAVSRGSTDTGLVYEVSMRSRQNRAYPHFDRIKISLSKFFDYLPPNSEVDGEFYSFDMDFTALSSVVRTVNTKHPKMDEVKYFIFDLIESNRLPFEERHTLLSKAYQQYGEDGHSTSEFYLLSYVVLNSHEEIEKCHRDYVAQGFEGIMLRKMAGNKPTQAKLTASQYKSGRSSNLLKYKHFLDEEVVILAVEEGTGREKGVALLKVRDVRGNEFTVRPRGSFDLRKSWFQNPQLVVGKAYTIRYQELSVYGVPRFPVGVALRDYE